MASDGYAWSGYSSGDANWFRLGSSTSALAIAATGESPVSDTISLALTNCTQASGDTFPLVMDPAEVLGPSTSVNLTFQPVAVGVFSVVGHTLASGDVQGDTPTYKAWQIATPTVEHATVATGASNTITWEIQYGDATEPAFVQADIRDGDDAEVVYGISSGVPFVDPGPPGLRKVHIQYEDGYIDYDSGVVYEVEGEPDETAPTLDSAIVQTTGLTTVLTFTDDSSPLVADGDPTGFSLVVDGSALAVTAELTDDLEITLTHTRISPGAVVTLSVTDSNVEDSADPANALADIVEGEVDNQSAVVAPSALTEEGTAPHSLEISWTTNDPPECDGYQVQASTDAFSTSIDTLFPGSGTVSGAVVGLESDTEYDLRIRAYYDVDSETRAYSAWSNTLTSTTDVEADPQNVTAKWTSDTSLVVEWDRVLGISPTLAPDHTMEVGYDTDIGFGTVTLASAVAIGTTICAITGLTPGTLYYVRVRHKVSGGTNSGYSSTASATTCPLASDPHQVSLVGFA